MTNKEMYKRAFSALHASGEFVEVNTMKKAKPVRLKRVAVLCAAVIFVLALASVAYAADVGGIQRQIQIWVDGDETDAILTVNHEGVYTVILDPANPNGGQVVQEGGGLAIDSMGNTRPLNEDEILEYLDTPDVRCKEDGSIWVSYREQHMNITDMFDENGVCHVMLDNGEETLYITVNRDGGYSVSTKAYK